MAAPEPIELVSDSPQATKELGARFAALCRPGDVVGLTGTLGAGKSCFVKGMARGLGVEEIARQARLHRGEVELILDLEKGFSL